MSDAQTDRSMRYAAGYVDRLGYLRCASCASDTQRDTPVRSAPHIDEPCDLCGRVLGAPANGGALVADAEASDA